MTSEPDIARGFRDVDRSGEPAAFTDYLEATQNALAELTARAIGGLALTAGGSALDVGCGTGAALRRLAELVGPNGRVVGVDASEALIAEARRRTRGDATVEAIVADGHALPFADHTFSAVRTERVLMHLDDPARALAEMTRVARPGGRVVAMEPDWDTLIVASADLATARRVVRAQADAIRHPDIGRRLAGLAERAGLELIAVDCATVAIPDPDLAASIFRIGQVVQELAEPAVSGWWSEARARRPFFASMTGVTVVGRKAT